MSKSNLSKVLIVYVPAVCIYFRIRIVASFINESIMNVLASAFTRILLTKIPQCSGLWAINLPDKSISCGIQPEAMRALQPPDPGARADCAVLYPLTTAVGGSARFYNYSHARYETVQMDCIDVISTVLRIAQCLKHCLCCQMLWPSSQVASLIRLCLRRSLRWQQQRH